MEISQQMSEWAKKGRKNLRERIGEEEFKKEMSRIGKLGGKPKKRNLTEIEKEGLIEPPEKLSTVSLKDN